MKENEKIEFDNVTQFGVLLRTARESEYDDMVFNLEYTFDSRFSYAADCKLKELGIENTNIRNSEIPNTSITDLNGIGVDGIERIMRFDAWLTLTIMLDVAADMRIKELDKLISQPKRFQSKKHFDRINQIPDNKTIEEEVKFMYLEQGLEL